MLIGRENEVRVLQDAVTKENSQFIAVYGRRRVDKTFLICEAYDYKFAFQYTGAHRLSSRQQLTRFRMELKRHGLKNVPIIPNWAEAFSMSLNDSCRTVQDKESETRGAQIDLLIDRSDGIIDLCEMKYSDSQYTITEQYESELRIKKDVFLNATRSRKALHTIMVTTYGLKQNACCWSIQKEVTMDALFE